MKTKLNIKYNLLGEIKGIEFEGTPKQYNQLCEILKLDESKKESMRKFQAEINQDGTSNNI